MKWHFAHKRVTDGVINSREAIMVYNRHLRHDVKSKVTDTAEVASKEQEFSSDPEVW